MRENEIEEILKQIGGRDEAEDDEQNEGADTLE